MDNEAAWQTAFAEVASDGSWFWTPAEVAKRVHFSQSKIRRDIQRGALHADNPGGSDTRVPTWAIPKYVQEIDCDCDKCTAKRAAWQERCSAG